MAQVSSEAFDCSAPAGPPKPGCEVLAEIIDRSIKDPDRRGCLLVNSALDVAPHDARTGRVQRVMVTLLPA
ncbi:hypothetical protein [Reyranella soli]|nr:hypothetical protein [Reyranella soli]